jgi:hypothetical protein
MPDACPMPNASPLVGAVECNEAAIFLLVLESRANVKIKGSQASPAHTRCYARRVSYAQRVPLVGAVECNEAAIFLLSA